jgi:uncharacterized protein YndB with AHSA1/START domain
VSGPPERVFEAFTAEIGRWWRPNSLFAFRPGNPGVLCLEPGPQGRLIETNAEGQVFEIGRIRLWQPPRRLVFAWRQASFAPDQETEVEVHFDEVGSETRVTVEHRGWNTVPAAHAARHGFPDGLFLRRHAEWWQALLSALNASMSKASKEIPGS